MRKYGLMVLLFVLGCETPFEPNIPNKKQIAVNSFFRPEAPIRVNLTTSNFIISPENMNPLAGAKVEISTPDGPFEELTYAGNGNYVGQKVVDTETMFSLNIVADGYPNLSSSDEIPEKIGISKFEIRSKLQAVNLEDVGYPAAITFNDPVGISNYYALEAIILNTSDPNTNETVFNGEVGELFFEDTEVNIIQNVNIDIGDFTNIEAFPTLYFDDISFKTETVEMQFFISPENVDPNDFDDYEIYVVLKSVSRSYYEFLRTTDFQQKIIEQGLPADPVQIQSNIQNGLGVFGGYNFSILKGTVLN